MKNGLGIPVYNREYSYMDMMEAEVREPIYIHPTFDELKSEGENDQAVVNSCRTDPGLHTPAQSESDSFPNCQAIQHSAFHFKHVLPYSNHDIVIWRALDDFAPITSSIFGR